MDPLQDVQMYKTPQIFTYSFRIFMDPKLKINDNPFNF